MSAFDEVRLATPRLRLRPLHDGDAPGLWAIFSDTRVMRYWSTAPWTTMASAHEMIARDQAAMARGDHLRLGIERVDDATLIGVCTLFNLVPQCRRAEVGYALGATAWGQGCMHEALTALLDHGFTSMRLNRVEADIDPRNTASARTLERLGFTREGCLRERWIVGDEVSDSALYGLLHSDWQARTSPG